MHVSLPVPSSYLSSSKGARLSSGSEDEGSEYLRKSSSLRGALGTSSSLSQQLDQMTRMIAVLEERNEEYERLLHEK
jgi:hypothetical protein